jgi:hypothetical protein
MRRYCPLYLVRDAESNDEHTTWSLEIDREEPLVSAELEDFTPAEAFVELIRRAAHGS